MDGKPKKKISLISLILIITAIILIMLALGLLYCDQKKIENKNKTITDLKSQISELSTNVNDKNKENLNKNKEIHLSNVEKVSINAGLDYSDLVEAIRYMNRTNIEYDINLLENEENKLYVVYELGENINYKKGEEGENEGYLSTELNALNKCYNEILGIDLNEQALLESSDDVNRISIRDGKLKFQVVTGWGSYPIALKAKRLELDENTKTYTLTTDLLYSENGVIDEEENNYAGKYYTLKYDSSLIKAEFEIKYQEKDNGDKILKSLILKK